MTAVLLALALAGSVLAVWAALTGDPEWETT